MKSLTLFAALAVLFLAAGCGKKEVLPVPVGKMNDYKDPGFGFTIQYPENWKQLGTVGKALFTESQEMADKFIDPTKGIEGGRVLVEALPYAGAKPEAMMTDGRAALVEQQAEVGADEALTVGGRPSMKVPYSFQATSKSKIFGYEIYVPGDTAMYKLTIEGFGDQYNAYAGVFDAMVKSFTVPVVVAKAPDVWSPAPGTSTLDSKYFTMAYPDNMEFVDVKKGDKDYVVEMRADRLDCTIHVDVFGAVGLTVEKVWEQNKGRYKARATGDTKIDGNQTYWVDYSVRSDIGSRAYFTVKNDKVIRTTLNWFAPKRDVYFPVLESMVKSMKLK